MLCLCFFKINGVSLILLLVMYLLDHVLVYETFYCYIHFVLASRASKNKLLTVQGIKNYFLKSKHQKIEKKKKKKIFPYSTLSTDKLLSLTVVAIISSPVKE